MPLIRVLCEKINFFKTHDGRIRIIALYEFHRDVSLLNLVDNQLSLTQFGLFAAGNLEDKRIRTDLHTNKVKKIIFYLFINRVIHLYIGMDVLMDFTQFVQLAGPASEFHVIVDFQQDVDEPGIYVILRKKKK